MRNPRPLTGRILDQVARGVLSIAITTPRVTRTVDAAELSRAELAEMDRAGKARRAALQAEIDATKAEIERVKANGGRASDGAGGFVRVAKLTRAHVPAPTPASPASVNQATVPTAPPPVKLAPLAPAPAPLPNPFEGVDVRGPLREGDWLGLSARVEAGKLTVDEAERIGTAWKFERQMGVC